MRALEERFVTTATPSIHPSMGFAPQSSTLLGSTLGVAFFGAALLAYTPDLQAGQKNQLERQVDALQRENRALIERLDSLEGSMLAAAPKNAQRPATREKTRKTTRKTTRKARKPSGSSKSKPHPGEQTSNPKPPPKSALEAQMEFQAKVRKALKKELERLEQLEDLDTDVADLQKDVGALKTHTHEISVPGRSPRAFIAKHAWDVVSDDAMIPYVPPESIGKGVADQTYTTTAPK